MENPVKRIGYYWDRTPGHFIFILLSGMLFIGSLLVMYKDNRSGFWIVANIGSITILVGSFLSMFIDRLYERRSSDELKYLNSAGAVWERSIDLLDRIRKQKGQKGDKHCYDITSVPNCLDYEQRIADILGSVASFERIFCYSDNVDNPNDKAVKWLYDKIVSKQQFDETSVEGEISGFSRCFSREHRRNLNRREIRQLCKIIGKFRQYKTGQFLKVFRLPFPCNDDFVAVRHKETAEVVSNFITEESGETYSAGIHSAGDFANKYISMFTEVLREWTKKRK